MRSIIKTLALTGIISLFITSCKKNDLQQEQQAPVSQEVLTQIHNMGFTNTNVQKIEEGYLVEGDIILTQNDFNSTTPLQALRIGNTEQYRTTNLVKALPRNITVSLSSRLPSSYIAALDVTVSRYN